MATTPQREPFIASPVERLQRLELAVLETLPPDGTLSIHGELMTQAAIIAELQGWCSFLEGVEEVAEEGEQGEETLAVGPILLRAAQAFATEVRVGLYRLLRGAPGRADLGSEAHRPSPRGTPQSHLAASKRAVTRELREAGGRKRRDRIPAGKLPRVH